MTRVDRDYQGIYGMPHVQHCQPRFDSRETQPVAPRRPQDEVLDHPPVQGHAVNGYGMPHVQHYQPRFDSRETQPVAPRRPQDQFILPHSHSAPVIPVAEPGSYQYDDERQLRTEIPETIPDLEYLKIAKLLLQHVQATPGLVDVDQLLAAGTCAGCSLRMPTPMPERQSRCRPGVH